MKCTGILKFYKCFARNIPVKFDAIQTSARYFTYKTIFGLSCFYRQISYFFTSTFDFFKKSNYSEMRFLDLDHWKFMSVFYVLYQLYFNIAMLYYSIIYRVYERCDVEVKLNILNYCNVICFNHLELYEMYW